MTKRIIVTGGGSGIGKAVVARFAGQGAEVVVLDLPGGAPAPGTAMVGCDLADPASIDDAVRELGDGWDALCNVAGIPGTHPRERVIGVNFLGLRHLTEALIPSMRSGGSIVQVASTAGTLWQQNLEMVRSLVATADFADGLRWVVSSSPDYPAYNLSKEAVIVYTMTLAQRAWNAGVTVNSISPGPVETPILPDFEESMGKPMLDQVKTTVGRHAQAEDIAPVIAFLASPEASWVNGCNIIVDAGFAALMTTAMAGIEAT
jgi:NAD(P)-dependent dehydrogenase (short-subunit alcohol dehydrogenase family)